MNDMSSESEKFYDAHAPPMPDGGNATGMGGRGIGALCCYRSQRDLTIA